MCWGWMEGEVSVNPWLLALYQNGNALSWCLMLRFAPRMFPTHFYTYRNRAKDTTSCMWLFASWNHRYLHAYSVDNVCLAFFFFFFNTIYSVAAGGILKVVKLFCMLIQWWARVLFYLPESEMQDTRMNLHVNCGLGVMCPGRRILRNTPLLRGLLLVGGAMHGAGAIWELGTCWSIFAVNLNSRNL